MAFWRTLACFSIIVVIFLLVKPPFVQCSRPSFQDGTKMAEETAAKGFGNGVSGFGVEASAREVPTGPDPLHHNNSPSRP